MLTLIIISTFLVIASAILGVAILVMLASRRIFLGMKGRGASAPALFTSNDPQVARAMARLAATRAEMEAKGVHLLVKPRKLEARPGWELWMRPAPTPEAPRKAEVVHLRPTKRILIGTIRKN